MSRKRLTREELNDRLAELNWELPDGVTYRGAERSHVLRCTVCGNLTEKWLPNVLHRKEQCCTVVPEHLCKPVAIKSCESTTENIDYKKIKSVVRDAVESVVLEAVAEIKEVVVGTAVNRDDLISKFIDLYGKTVSRKGFIMYDRKMSDYEWWDMSERTALELIELFSNEDMREKVKKGFIYKCSKNPTVKPENNLLQIMNKIELYTALNNLHILRASL